MKHSTIPTVLSLGLGLLASIAGAVEMAVVSSSISLRRDDCYNFQVPIAIAEVDPDSENDRDFECYFYAEERCRGDEVGYVSSDETRDDFDDPARSVECWRT